jgi:hypothetical protein
MRRKSPALALARVPEERVETWKRSADPAGTACGRVLLWPKTSITSVRGTRTMTEGARIREVFLCPAPVTPSTGRAASTPR